MGRLATCKECGIKLTKEEKHMLNNKCYCLECFRKKQIEATNYNNLISSICTYFSIEAPSGLILKQIKDYKNNYNYSYSGIQYCLWYITEILRKKLDKKYGIAYVKYEYENSKEYYNHQIKISESLKNVKINESVVKKVTIKKQDNRNKFLINLDELE